MGCGASTQPVDKLPPATTKHSRNLRITSIDGIGLGSALDAGDTVQVEFSASKSVHQLRRLLLARELISKTSNVDILFAGARLPPHGVLQSLGISEGALLQLVGAPMIKDGPQAECVEVASMIARFSCTLGHRGA